MRAIELCGGVLVTALLAATAAAQPQCCESKTWLESLVAGPSPRHGHAMASGCGGVLLFGGINAVPAYVGDTWFWNGASWSQVSSTGPSPRSEHAMAFDEARNEVVLYGGATASGVSNQTWVWSCTTQAWSGPFSTEPGPRLTHALAYDRTRKVVVLFGGTSNGSDYKADTWEWNGASKLWQLKSSTFAGGGRQNAAMAFDDVRGKIILFGGQAAGGVLKLDTWDWNGTTWTSVPAGGPSPRAGHALAANPQCKTILLFGGNDPSGPVDDTWEWNETIAAWVPIGPGAGPTPRLGHALAYDPVRQNVAFFGGSLAGVMQGDTWLWSTPPDDCNLNGVPDVCECLPTQKKMPDGGGTGGPAPQSTWRMRAKLLRFWLQKDGDPWIGKNKGGYGDGTVVWKTRTQDAPFGEYAASNKGTVPVDVYRTPQRKQQCEDKKKGRKEYQWNAVNEDIFTAHGTGTAPKVEIDLKFWEYDTDYSKLYAKAGDLLVAIAKCLKKDKSCVSEVVQKAGEFLSALDELEKKGRSLGKLLLLNYTFPTGSEAECTKYNECPRPYTSDIIGAEYSLESPIKGKPAQVQIAWEQQTGRTTQFGQSATDAQGDGLTDEEDLVFFEYGQLDGSRLFFRAVLPDGADVMQYFGSGHDRTFHIYCNIDNNQSTGAPAPPACGAEYDIRVQLYNDSATGQVRSDAEIFSWCQSAWQGTGAPPDETEPIDNQLRLLVSMRKLGICEVGRQITAWVVVERNTTVSDAIPTDPCGTELRIPVEPDTGCPAVTRLLAQRAGDLTITALEVYFTEPMDPAIVPADLELFLPGPLAVPFNLAWDADWTVLYVTPSGSPTFPPGRLTLRLHDTITDLAGNALDGDEDGFCGGTAEREFCSPEVKFYACDAAGAAKAIFANAEAVYARGSGLPASQAIRLYVIPAGSAAGSGNPLIDLSDDGYQTATTTAAGDLAVTKLGGPVPDSEYQLVADVSNFGLYDPGTDKLFDTCAGLVVGHPCETAAHDPLAYYPLDEVAGPYTAERIAGLVGQYNGAPLPVAGQVGPRGLSFNGSSFVQVPDDDDLNLYNEFTIEGWLKVDAGTAAGGILGKRAANQGYSFEVLGSAGGYRLTLTLEDGAQAAQLQSDTGLTPGVWTHVAVTGSVGGEYLGATFFINGQPASEFGAISGLGPVDNTGPFWLGRAHAGYLKGALDDVALYDEALTPADIALIHRNGPRGKCNVGDVNCDGKIDSFDIDPFVLALTDAAGYAEDYPACEIQSADVNRDGQIDAFDIDPFVALLTGG